MHLMSNQVVFIEDTGQVRTIRLPEIKENA